LSTNPDTVYLGHMALAIERIGELVGRIDRADFERDWTLQNAVIRELEVLGEAAGKLSAEFVNEHRDAVPWKEVTGLRHKLIHDYFEVDLEIVWRTATINIPEIATFIGKHGGKKGP
jgi:uncharacterized protein with HEPN domain